MTGPGLLVTTSFSFLRLAPDTGAVSVIHQGDGLYYGITQSRHRVFVAARRRLVSSGLPTEREQGVILVFDRRLRHIDTLTAPFPLRDMHEICWHRGVLWVTCSFDNMVAIYDGRAWHQWYPLGQPDALPADINHFNSFMIRGNRLWLLAHNNGPSTLLVFDLPDRHRVGQQDLGIQAHNIRECRGQILTCSSGEGAVVGNRGFRLHTGGFPRGMAVLNRRRYIGISALAERKQRDFTSGHIRVYTDHWQFRHRIDLPGQGLILDMSPLPGRRVTEIIRRPLDGFLSRLDHKKNNSPLTVKVKGGRNEP